MDPNIKKKKKKSNLADKKIHVRRTYSIRLSIAKFTVKSIRGNAMSRVCVSRKTDVRKVTFLSVISVLLAQEFPRA